MTDPHRYAAPATPAPDLEPDPNWTDRAACADPRHNPDWWFPVGATTTIPTAVHALAICRRCPVVEHCLAHALTEGIRDGIWGATTEHTRRRLHRHTRRNRNAA